MLSGFSGRSVWLLNSALLRRAKVIYSVTISFLTNRIWLHQLVGGNTGPECNLLHFDEQEQFKPVISGVRVAIWYCVYV